MNKFRRKLSVILAAATIFSVLCLPIGAQSTETVYTGGFPFGIRIYTDGLVVVGLSDVNTAEGAVSPAEKAGIMAGDIIKEVNGTKITSSEEFLGSVENDADPVELLIERDGETSAVTIKPALSSDDGKYRTGMWLRDSTAGIGTVTFVVPETGEFCGLGHGICDSKTGELLPLMRGVVSEVQISGVSRGVPGTPGELKGYFGKSDSGLILKNTEHGVYGLFHSVPGCAGKKICLGERDGLHTGEASVICTVDGGEAKMYSIEITGLGDGKDSASFDITVTDSELIEKTGGIVQGMSGSPVIQDGKLVGAVTHVMVNDPLRGYGIYIDKMIELAE